jgi:hypothetical protein
LPRFSENLKPYKLKFFAYKQNTAFHSPTTLCSKPNFEQHVTAETAKTLFQRRPRVTTTTTTNTHLNATMSQSPIAGQSLLFFSYSFFVEEKDVFLRRRREIKDSKKKKKKRRRG